MNNETQVQPQPTGVSKLPVKEFFESGTIRQKFEQLLGQRAPGFITSVLQVVSNNKLLANADPKSIYNAASMAAILDLPINQNLGFAWIVPYGGAAQFQIGVKGFVQLAQRTGQYIRLNVTPVYESQFVSWDALREELQADFTKPESGNVVGYCAYFKLANGYEKTVYWSKEKVLKHAQRYSKSFGSGPWQTHFDEMSCKTVLKHALSKWGILSIDMQKAVIVDQAVIKNDEGTEVEYADAVELKPDVSTVSSEKENTRIMKHIAKSLTIAVLEQVQDALSTDEQHEAYIKKEKEIRGE